MPPTDAADSAGPGPPGLAAGQSSAAGHLSDQRTGPSAFEGLERLQLVETLSYGNVYESRLFQASRSEATTLLALAPELVEDPDTRSAAVRELLASCRLPGANILSPRGLYRDGETLYALFDANPGVSLATGFDFLEQTGLRLSSEAILRIASGVLHALDQISGRDSGSGDEPRCHGVLVPENVRIVEGQRVLIRGIGLEKAGILRTRLLSVRERRFLAPGRNEGATASPVHDLISLGAMLFEAVAGCPAFDAPPNEGDVDELSARIEEIRSTSDPLRRELFSIVLACLLPAAATPSSLVRLRVLVDTLFLREAARERVSGTLSLEELVSRVKFPRPAIVKARPLSVLAVEAPPRYEPRRAEPGPSIEVGEETVAVAAEARPIILPAPSSRKRGVSFRVGLFSAAALLVIAGIVVVAFPRRPESGSSPAAPMSVSPLEPKGALPEPSPLSADPPGAALPASAVPPAPERPAESPAVTSSKTTASTAATGSARPRAARARPAGLPAARSDGEEAPAPEEPAGQAGAAVVPGSLVALGTQGLVSPVLLQEPEPLHFSPLDLRPPVATSALLDLLVGENGKVLDYRILQASRPPSGFGPAVSRYVAALRFRPGELRGVAVRVWFHHELRFTAPS